MTPDLTDGLCATVDPELFFAHASSNDHQAAVRICRSCPLRAPCLEWAILSPQSGTWGGTNERQRRAIARKRRLPYNLAATALYAGPDAA